MSGLVGGQLHHAVAVRIVGRYLRDIGANPVEDARDYGTAVDIVCENMVRSFRVMVKADPYFGTEPAKIADRDLSFYRREGSDYAFEAVSDSETQQQGWVFDSFADEVHYYFLALGQPEAEVSALLGEADDVFFGELVVERDELHIIPMGPLRAWFVENYERYTPRPVLIGGHTAWYRLVTRDALRAAVPVEVVGPVFGGLSDS
jgi:hypothetical protein